MTTTPQTEAMRLAEWAKDKAYIDAEHCNREYEEIADELRRLDAENRQLKEQVHNLNWALGTEGYEQMFTPEQQAESGAAHEKVKATIAAMQARKERHQSLVPEGVDVLDYVDQLRAQVEQLKKRLFSALESEETLAKAREKVDGVDRISPMDMSNLLDVAAANHAEAKALRAQVERLQGGEPVAYLTEDGERCVTARTYNAARKDGGAIWSTMKPFCVPAFAAQPAAPAMVAWQPIETAPKDGAVFLCWVHAVRYGETDEGQQYQQDVSQIDFCEWRTQKDIPDCGWFEPFCGQIGDQQCVTHWMSLPPAPVGIGQPAGGEKQV